MICITGAGAEVISKYTQDAINQLDRALDKREYYINARQTTIDSLKNVYSEDRSPRTLFEIGNAYTQFVNDSALAYFQRAGLRAVNTEDSLRARLRIAEFLPLAGLYETAEVMFNDIDTTAISPDLRILYHNSGRQMYSYLASAYVNYKPNYDRYKNLSLNHQRQLLELLDKNSDEYLFNLGEYYFLSGDTARSEVLLRHLSESSNDKALLAKANHHLSAISQGRKDTNGYLSYLAKSALSDVETANLEVISLQELGSALYFDGDVERSYRYLSTALDNAVHCGAGLRMIESSRVLPLIAHAHNRQTATLRIWSYVVIGILALLLIGLVITLVLLYREMKRLDHTQRRLRIANSSKDVYLSQFLQLCSIYMDKLNRFCKLAERKISAGKTDEFYRMVKSGKFIEEESSDFHKAMDDAFLHLYPDFVSQVNNLLRPECRITLQEGERLNTDLRILAIRRMGIDDAASIAQMLNYSLNTIYAYRNRLKSRAIDRDNFEDDIMKIRPRI